jgi:tetratricopeptide (TPR) repeat protein
MRRNRTESRITSFLWALETAGDLGDNPKGEKPFCLLAQYYRYFRIFDGSNARPAIRYANRAIESGDHPADAYVTLGVVAYRTGRRQEALSHFLKAVETNPKHALAHRWAALIYSDQGDLANEYQALNAADELAPGDPFHALDLDHFLIHKSGDYRRALDRTLKRLGDIPPDSTDVWQVASLYRSLGEQEEAVRYYQSAIQLQPRNPSLYEDMAYSLRELGQTNEAIAAYQQAISIAPYRPTPHAGLGFIYHKDARYPEAVGEFEQALRYGDRSIETHAGLCSLYLKTGAFERALDCFQHLLERDPKNRTAANLLPYTMANLRRKEPK